MPKTLMIRQVDDHVVAVLKRRAARNARSVAAEVRAILTQLLAGRRPEFWDTAAELRQRTRGRNQTPSEVLLREGREGTPRKLDLMRGEIRSSADFDAPLSLSPETTRGK